MSSHQLVGWLVVGTHCEEGKKVVGIFSPCKTRYRVVCLSRYETVLKSPFVSTDSTRYSAVLLVQSNDESPPLILMGRCSDLKDQS